jgi:hypothetical protein
LPAQQLAFALHELVDRRQIAPAGLQELPLVHRPTSFVPDFSQVTWALSPSGNPSDPQQSLSARQTSPVGRQPLAGWQINIPIGPKGRHARLQHSPPHTGSSPPS